MKTDLDVIKNILSVIHDSESAFVTLGHITKSTNAKGDVFLHHYLMLAENSLICGIDLQSSPKSIGLPPRSDNLGDGYYYMESRKIRMTESGRKMLEALTEPTINKKLKSVGDFTLSTIADVAKTLVVAYTTSIVK